MECIENIALFVQFMILLLWVARDKIFKNTTIWTVLWNTTEIKFLFSFTIEMRQVFLRLGTWGNIYPPYNKRTFYGDVE